MKEKIIRNPIENISRLQKQMNDLQLENQILKNILDSAGISYQQEIMRLRATEEFCDYDPNQGARILAPDKITDKMAVMFLNILSIIINLLSGLCNILCKYS